MSKLIHVASEENGDVCPVARLLQSVMKESKGQSEISQFENEFVELIEKEDYYGIFSLFAGMYDVINSVPDKTGSKNKMGKAEKLEAYFTTLIYLSNDMPTLPKIEATVYKVVELLSRDAEYGNLRLRLLQMCYNSIPVHEKTAHLSQHMFFSVLDYAGKAGLFAEMVPYLDFFENWLEDWAKEPKLNQESKARLYYTVSQQIPNFTPDQMNKLRLDEKTRSTLAFTWLNKYLEVETEVNPQSVAAIQELLLQTISNPGVYTVDSLLSIEIVQAAREKDEWIAKVCQIVGLLNAGEMSDWEQVKIEHADLLNSERMQEIKAVECMDLKMRVLSLSKICENRKEVPLAEIRERDYNCQVGATISSEDVIITASHHNVLVGRIDEQKQLLHVQSVLQRNFGTSEWKQLGGVITEWMAKINYLRGFITEAKESQKKGAPMEVEGSF